MIIQFTDWEGLKNNALLEKSKVISMLWPDSVQFTASGSHCCPRFKYKVLRDVTVKSASSKVGTELRFFGAFHFCGEE